MLTLLTYVKERSAERDAVRLEVHSAELVRFELFDLPIRVLHFEFAIFKYPFDMGAKFLERSHLRVRERERGRVFDRFSEGEDGGCNHAGNIRYTALSCNKKRKNFHLIM